MCVGSKYPKKIWLRFDIENSAARRTWIDSLTQPLHELSSNSSRTEPVTSTTKVATQILSGIASKCITALMAPLNVLTHAVASSPHPVLHDRLMHSSVTYAKALAGACFDASLTCSPVLEIIKLLPNNKPRQAKISFNRSVTRSAEAAVVLPDGSLRLMHSVLQLLAKHACELLHTAPLTYVCRQALVTGLLAVRCLLLHHVLMFSSMLWSYKYFRCILQISSFRADLNDTFTTRISLFSLLVSTM